MSGLFATSAGKPWPLGASDDGDGVNFALFSQRAKRVYLCLFNTETGEEVQQVEIINCTDFIWHIKVLGLTCGAHYAYRVEGPHAPEKGERFNSKKLLLDPYARKLDGCIHWGDALFAYDKTSALLDLSSNDSDSAASVPKCVVVARKTHQEIDAIQRRKPRVPWSQTIIYETHVKGFTQLNANIPEAMRGTFTALAQPEVRNYLKDLGISALELLPVHYFVSEEFLVKNGLSNYWGYNTLNFFTPHPDYLHTQEAAEFLAFVEAYHADGLEIILDVVFNHTAESNQLGPSLSYRGIDNQSYYRLEVTDSRLYVNDTGCGNTFNCDHPRVLQLVMDSLRFWAGEMGVDGFRFDLASILGRSATGFSQAHSFFAAIQQDPLLSTCKLIAEPWDVGPGGYQLGNFPMPWSEWNDKYRDTVRRFWRGDPGLFPEFARRIHGSSDVFESSGRRPRSSINFVTSHDGFTLHDLVTYRERHNLANKEENRDGHSANYSENYGVEGETHVREINELRLRQKKNILATLFLSHGVPMLLSGDEIGNSQRGNNNAYCQDNPISWIDWKDCEKNTTVLQDFVRSLIQLRKREPLLHWNDFIHTPREYTNQNPASVRWLRSDGKEMRPEDWSKENCFELGWLIEGNILGGLQALLLIFNSASAAINWNFSTVGGVGGNSIWRCIVNTAMENISENTIHSGFVVVPGRSVMVLKRHPGLL